MLNELARSQWALTILRIFLGITFIAHGSQKVFGWFGGSGLSGFVGWLAHSFQIPAIIGYIAAYSELIAGLLLLFGIFPEFGAFLIICIMIAAIYLVHAEKGFFIMQGGYEYSLCLLIVAVAIIIGGPGKLALWDGKFFEWL